MGEQTETLKKNEHKQEEFKQDEFRREACHSSSEYGNLSHYQA